MMKKITKIKITIVAVVTIILAMFIWWMSSGTELHSSKEGHIEITPVQVEKIKSIGQWEFLSVSDEEIVDTVRHSFFGDDQLSRIYYGTLRLGIDLNDAEKDWITMDNDTVVVKLPPVKLLDENFIDEARTRAFIEDGKWSEADRAALTQKAIRLMRKRCLTKANIQSADDNAQTQMKKLIQAMGFEYVKFNP